LSHLHNRSQSRNKYPDSVSDNENNNIDKVYTTDDKQNPEPNMTLSTETRVQVVSTNNQLHLQLGLLDTVATGTYVSASAIHKIKHEIEPVNVRVLGRYSPVTHTKWLPLKFSSLTYVTAKLSPQNHILMKLTVGFHDIVMGHTSLSTAWINL
jgi:hypothetical protein